MSIPDSAVEVPRKVRELAAGAPLVCMWVNDYGGMTFRADPPGAEPFFVKWGPRNDESNMRDEAERMRWARQWVLVPEVVAEGRDAAH